MELEKFFWLISIFWLVLTLAWCCCLFHQGLSQSKTLHYIFLAFFVFKTLSTVISLLVLPQCQREKFCDWDFLINFIDSISNTLLFSEILLISHGFNLLRDYLTNDESVLVTLKIVFIYVGYGLYELFPFQFIFLLVFIVLGVTYIFCSNMQEQLKTLNTRKAEYLIEDNLDLASVIQEKIKILKWVSVLVYFLLTGKVIYLTVKWIQFRQFLYSELSLIDFFDSLNEAFVLSNLVFVFCPKKSSVLNRIFFERSGDENESSFFFLEGRVPKGFNVEVRDKPFLVIVPKGKKMCTYKNIMIARPYSNK